MNKRNLSSEEATISSSSPSRTNNPPCTNDIIHTQVMNSSEPTQININATSNNTSQPLNIESRVREKIHELDVEYETLSRMETTLMKDLDRLQQEEKMLKQAKLYASETSQDSLHRVQSQRVDYLAFQRLKQSLFDNDDSESTSSGEDSSAGLSGFVDI